MARPNLSFCKKISNAAKFSWKTRKNNPDKYVKIIAGIFGGYKRGQFDYRAFVNLFSATQSNHLDISYKYLESGLPIESFNELFIDEVYFSAKGSTVFSQFFEEYFERNHWLDPEV